MQGALKSLCSFNDAEVNNKKKAESIMRQALHAYVMAELCPPTPQICMLSPYLPVPLNVTISGDRVIKEVTEFK